MATETVNHGTPEQRNKLVLEIAWELDKIARSMPGMVPVDEDQSHFVVRAFCGRMLRLTSVMMDLGQNIGKYDAMRDIVTLDGDYAQG